MWLAEWVTSLVDEFGLPRVLMFPATAIVAVAGLASMLGAYWVPIVFLAGALFMALVLLAVSLTRVRGEQEESRHLRWALKNLREHVNSSPAHTVTVLWRDEFTVSKKGDTHAVRRFVTRVEPGPPLHFLEVAASGDALDERDKRRIKFDVRESLGGAHLVTETEWLSPDPAQIWIHLEQPVPPGGEVSFVLSYD